MEKIIKILIVEDTRHWYEGFREELAAADKTEKIKIFWAETIKKAESLLAMINDFNIVVIDACVPGETPNTMPLIRTITTSGRNCPIVTFSRDPEYNQELMKAGATHLANKRSAAKVVLNILQLT